MKIFEVGWADHAEVGMASMAVVEDLDQLGDGARCLKLRAARDAIDELGLQRREEALGDGVVPAVALAAHAADDAGGDQRLAVVAARVLRAAVGVVHEAGVGEAATARHLQRVEAELGAHVIGDRPADDAAREQVEDDGEVQPALPRPHVRDVGRPHAVRRRRFEVPVEHVRRDRRASWSSRSCAETAASTALRALLAHHPRDALAARRAEPSARSSACTRGLPYVPRLRACAAAMCDGELRVLASARRLRSPVHHA